MGSPGEELVVLGCAQETDDAQLDHEVIDDLLRQLLGQGTRREIPFEIDVKERRGAPERHRGAVLLFDAGEVPEIKPLDCLSRAARRARDVEPVARRHLLQFLERADLLGQLLAVANHVVGGMEGVERALLFLLALDQPLDAVERDPSVVADDASAPVGVGQAGQHVRAAAPPHVGRVGVEHRVVVGLAVLAEGLHHLRVRLVAVRLQRIDDEAQAAVGHDRPLERRVGLQPDDDLVVAVDVAGGVRRDRAGYLGDVEHALAAFLDEQLLEDVPDVLGPRCRGLQKGRISVVRLVVLLNEIANVDFLLPETGSKPLPGRGRSVDRLLLRNHRGHVVLLAGWPVC